MRNPSKKAVIFASLVALGLALAWIGIENHVPLGGDWVPGLMIVGGGLMAFACWAWFEAERTGWTLDKTMAPFITLIVASMAALFAVVLGGLTLLLRPRPTR